LDGADRGQVFEDLEPPVNGREGQFRSTERRTDQPLPFKIQEDQGKLVLTDLESTNGTRVNGEDTQLRILRFGDVISLGRSVLLFGTRDQIAGRLEELRSDGITDTSELIADQLAQRVDSKSISFELRLGASEDLQSTLHMPSPPDLPDALSPGQAAVSDPGISPPTGDNWCSPRPSTSKPARRHCRWRTGRNFSTCRQLAEYLRTIGDPEGAE
jgi:hypothetical protein